MFYTALETVSYMSEEYTLPRVMQFLQLEWQRNERDKIQWELERAEMKSRIAKLEAEKLEKDRLLSSANKTIQMLKINQPQDETPETAPEDTKNLAKLAQARQYLEECVYEVRTLLEQTGISQPEQPYLSSSSQFGARSRLIATLSNFNGNPVAIRALLGHLFIIGTDEGKLILWDVDNAHTTIESTTTIVDLFLDPSLDQIFVVCTTNIQVWSLDVNGRLMKKTSEMALEKLAVSANFSKKLGLIAVCLSDGALIIVKTTALKIDMTLRYFPESMETAPTATIFVDQRLIVGYNDGAILLADPLSGQLVRRIFTPPAQALLASKTSPAVTAISILNESTIAVGNASGDLKLFDSSKGSLKEDLVAAHAAAITSLSRSPNKTNILSTGADGQVSLWAVNLGSIAWYGRLLSHDMLESGGALCSEWSNENLVAIGAGDGLVRAYSSI